MFNRIVGLATGKPGAQKEETLKAEMPTVDDWLNEIEPDILHGVYRTVYVYPKKEDQRRLVQVRLKHWDKKRNIEVEVSAIEETMGDAFWAALKKFNQLTVGR